MTGWALQFRAAVTGEGDYSQDGVWYKYWSLIVGPTSARAFIDSPDPIHASITASHRELHLIRM